MPYMKLSDFKNKLISEFNLNKNTFKCYTLDSNPTIKIILFGTEGWDKCHIGFLIDHKFHVLGLGSLTFKNEPARALYITLNNSLPSDKQTLKVLEYTLFDEEEQDSII